MPGFSNYLEQVVLNHFFRGASYTPPSTIYVSLHTGDPGDTGANELTAPSYARAAITFSAPSGGSISNAATVSWTAGENWGTITHFALWDSATGGNPLADGAFTTSLTIMASGRLTIGAGQLTLLFGSGTNLSTAFRNLILDRIFRAASYTPTTPYASLHTADPGDTGTNEASGGSYARQGVTFGAPAVDGTGYSIVNTADITFSPPAGTYTHLGLWTASTGGTFILRDTLGDVSTDADSPATIASGDQLVIPAGSLKVKVD